MTARKMFIMGPAPGPRVDIDTERLVRPTREPSCDACDHPCEAQCPQNALKEGTYSHYRCMARMDADKAEPVRGKGRTGTNGPVDNFRIRELICPAYRELK